MKKCVSREAFICVIKSILKNKTKSVTSSTEASNELYLLIFSVNGIKCIMTHCFMEILADILRVSVCDSLNFKQGTLTSHVSFH